MNLIQTVECSCCGEESDPHDMASAYCPECESGLRESFEPGCGYCGHPRSAHEDNKGQPVACCIKDEGEQCRAWVEPERRFTLAEVEAAVAVADRAVYDHARPPLPWRAAFGAALENGGRK